MFRAAFALAALVTVTAPLNLATPVVARPLIQNGPHPQGLLFGADLVTLGPQVYQASPQRGVRPPRQSNHPPSGQQARPRCVAPDGRVVAC
jgi:hypothetical protein